MKRYCKKIILRNTAIFFIAGLSLVCFKRNSESKIPDNNNFSFQEDMAVKLYNSGKFNEAIKIFKKLADLGALENKLNLALALKNIGYYDKAIIELNKCSVIYPKNLTVLKLLGRIYYLKGLFDEAISILEKACLISCDDYEVNINLGLCFAEKNEFKKAEVFYRKALGLKEDDFFARISLADLYRRENDLPRAIDEYKKAKEIDSSFLSIYKNLADMFFETGNLKEAYSSYVKMNLIVPQDEVVLGKLNELKIKLGNEYFSGQKEKLFQSKVDKADYVKPIEVIKNVVYVKVGLIQNVEAFEFKVSGNFEVLEGTKKIDKVFPSKVICGLVKGKEGGLFLNIDDKENIKLGNSFLINPQETGSSITIFDMRFGGNNYWSGEEHRSFRGKIQVNLVEDGMNIINIVNIEEYLYGVLPSEMPSNWPIEALKAQAVAARSEAFAKLGRHKDQGFDFCSEVHCKVYSGIENESEKSRLAVDQTRGIILAYKDKVVDAIYSSNCGGHTQDNIFGFKEAITYLKGRPDSLVESNLKFPLAPLKLEVLYKTPPPDLLCLGDAFMRGSNVRWVRLYKVDELSELVNKDYNIGNVKKIIILKRAPSGHIGKIRIMGEKGDCIVEKELYIRKVLGSLRSSSFNLEVALGQDNYPEEFIFYGAGWGHGVGMCQVGSYKLAKLGKTYEEILKHYFDSVVLKKIY